MLMIIANIFGTILGVAAIACLFPALCFFALWTRFDLPRPITMLLFAMGLNIGLLVNGVTPHGAWHLLAYYLIPALALTPMRFIDSVKATWKLNVTHRARNKGTHRKIVAG